MCDRADKIINKIYHLKKVHESLLKDKESEGDESVAWICKLKVDALNYLIKSLEEDGLLKED